MNDESKDTTGQPRNTTLKAFIDESKARLRKILERLEWRVESTIVQDTNSVDATQKDIHLDIDSEPELPPSYANGNSIKTDVAELRKIVSDESIEVPRRFSDLQLNFKRQQKLAIYEHAVANTEKCTVPVINVPALNEGTLTFAEIVAQKKRETKKRRRYRRSKPTHIEEVRAVVDLQMQALQQYLKTKAAEERRTKSEMYKEHKRPSKERLSRRTTREPEKHYKYQKSKSRSFDRKSSKKNRHRSRSPVRSHKHQKHKEHVRDRSSSRKRKNYKHRSRSLSTSNKRKSLKRKSHSRSIEKKNHKRRSRSHSRDRHRGEVPYHRSENHRRHKVRL